MCGCACERLLDSVECVSGSHLVCNQTLAVCVSQPNDSCVSQPQRRGGEEAEEKQEEKGDGRPVLRRAVSEAEAERREEHVESRGEVDVLMDVEERACLAAVQRRNVDTYCQQRCRRLACDLVSRDLIKRGRGFLLWQMARHSGCQP